MRKNKKVFNLIVSFVCALGFTACNFDGSEKTSDYKVLHYLQNIENDEYTLFETEDFSGSSGNPSSVAPKNYEGFTALPIESQKKSDKQTIIIKYNRNIITCTLNFNGGKIILEDGSEKTYDVISGKYGAEIDAPKPVKKGCILEDWIDSNGNSIGATFRSNGIYNASYVAKTTSSYVVHHLYQNIEDDGYTENLLEKEILEGTSGTKTAAAGKISEGFTSKVIQQKTILADESTEVFVYYDRKLVTFTFNLAGGEGALSVTRRYGTMVTPLIINEPAKENSTFSG